MDYDINDPIVKHFHDKNPSMNIAMISKLIDSISQEQTVLGFNINLHDFWSDYLSNNQEHKYTIIGEQMTATEAVNKIPSYSSLINSLDRICDTVTGLSDEEQVDYIYYKYPTIQSIEKNLKKYSDNNIDKLSYVIQHTDFNANYTLQNMPKSKVDISGWNNYNDKINEQIGLYARNIQNAGIYYDNYVTPNENPVADLAKIYNMIIINNDTLNSLDKTHYGMSAGALTLYTTGALLNFLGIILLSGVAREDWKASKKSMVDADAMPQEVQQPQRVGFKNALGQEVGGRLIEELDLRERSSSMLEVGVDNNNLIDAVTGDPIERQDLIADLLTNGRADSMGLQHMLTDPYIDANGKLTGEVLVRGRYVDTNGNQINIMGSIIPNGDNGASFFSGGSSTMELLFNHDTGKYIPVGHTSALAKGEIISQGKNITYGEVLNMNSSTKGTNCSVVFCDHDRFYNFNLGYIDQINTSTYNLTNNSNVTFIGLSSHEEGFPAVITDDFRSRNIPVWADVVASVIGLIALIGGSAALLKEVIPFGNMIATIVGGVLIAIGSVLLAIGIVLGQCANNLAGIIHNLGMVNTSVKTT